MNMSHTRSRPASEGVTPVDALIPKWLSVDVRRHIGLAFSDVHSNGMD